jgi:hypothetical protein
MAAPWLIFLPPRFSRVRLTACALMISLQIGIGITGNYGFFNLLTIVLYLAVLDDRTLGRLLPSRLTPTTVEASSPPRGRAHWRTAANVMAIVIAALSVMTLFREIDRTRRVRGLFDQGWPEKLLTWVSPLKSVNGYGLFRVMTTSRPEIVIEVSEDGFVWKEQEFRWKPGNVMRRPRFVEPHMPRLDWQMWFAALDPSSAAEWLLRLADHLIAGDPAVVRLLGPNPLPGRPRYVRLAYYQYHFTSYAERGKTNSWWKRDFVTYLSEPIDAERRPGAAADRP